MERTEEMEALTDKLHGGQKRQDGSTNAMHVRRVRRLAVTALFQTGEQSLLPDPIGFECAALGHDLLEDTPVTEEDVKKIAGDIGLGWIKELTNTWGDSHTGPYIEQVVNASEEARLIKYADLCDNSFQASYNIRILGVEWMENFFLPIIDPISAALAQTNFSRYPKTAELLRSTYILARTHLGESITMMQ